MMRHVEITRLVLSLWLATGTLLAQSGPVQAKGSKPAAPPVVIGFSPEIPKPPAAPQVICSGGEVTVSADNSTLSSVLKAVAGCSGTIVHMPAAIGATRVVGKYGPVAPMAIFASLLDGSADYFILGSQASLGRVQMVIVTPHKNASGAARAVPQAKEEAKEQTFIDEEGVERLLSGLTAEEATLSPEELAQRFEAARAEQRRLDELAKHPD